MQQTVTMRELHRNLKKIGEEAQKGQTFVVIKNSKPAFTIGPVEEESTKFHTLKDLKKLRFRSGQGDLSQRIDEILYGGSV